ncbi:shikimate dehydrogenase [Streptacidiphilus sp. MAP12-16]|uniref:shikimate dehydrogenase n=1 Tax=Streptacidiphilus sp. MAP12-16 TaxID=3156300 RepID=UPI003518E10C
MKQLALLGSPVGDALSPILHRAAYTELGLPWRYSAIDCPPDQLENHLAECRAGAWAGFSLTMPLKRVAIPMLDEISELVRQTGAVNTVVARETSLIGENTDVHGMTQALRGIVSSAPTVVTILGGGATAATALAAARNLGAVRATAVLRNPARALPLEETAQRTGIELLVRLWSEAEQHLTADLVISTVPPGAADRLAARWPPGSGSLLDVVYRPWPTPLARSARLAGRTVTGGLVMLVHQAALQVVLQTGCPAPPLAALRRAAALTASASDDMSITC